MAAPSVRALHLHTLDGALDAFGAARAGRLSRSTAKPWFMEVISTLPVV